VTLTDAGALIALLDRSDADHAACAAAAARLPRPMITTWPAFTEAMHMLGRIGWRAQQRLWLLHERGELELIELDASGAARARELMERYRSIRMDLADATLVALAEVRGLRQVFTLDGEFRVYRVNGRTPFEVLP
jgi:uncharacterized protein